MLFGEIVEPVTRALIDDEADEYPQYVPDIRYEGSLTVPHNIDTLIIVESSRLIKLFQSLIVKKGTLYTHIVNGDLKIYQFPQNLYVALYSEKDLTTGEITQQLANWLTKTTNIIGITSEPMAKYQNLEMFEKPECLIRVIGTKNSKKYGINNLESPNLVTGLGADCLTNCLYRDLDCSLFVVYLNSTPMDSINTEPIIKLIRSLGLKTEQFDSKVNPQTSNLYM